jgi:D-alanyl-D-alanine carboxypeptidase
MAVGGQWRWPRRRHGLTTVAIAVAAWALGSAAHATGKNAALVLDGNTGRVLYQSSADEPRHPASLAKMMTLYLVFDLIEQGRLNYQTRIKISANAAGAAPSKLDLEPGEEIALIDAVKVLITKSANDLAVAVAEHIAGSEERFARLMTQKARELGMVATTFTNASGLPDEHQLTNARDMATLALRLHDDFPRHYPLFATRTFTYKDETFRNHNTLLFHYPGTEGLKTGYTHASGFNLVASVRRGRKHVIGVMFGGASAASRNAAMRTLLNMGLLKASNEKTRRPALVARATSPPERKVVAAPSPQPATPPARTAAPEQGSVQAALYPIDIARVRSIRVVPWPAEAQESPRGETGSIEAILERSQATRQDSQQAAPSAPSGLASLMTGATAPAPAMRLSPAPSPDRPALMSEAMLARATAPSTLEQQAANLSRGEPALTSLPQHSVRALPESNGVAKSAGGFQIQIGAFQSVTEAERQLAAVRERAGGLLGNLAAITQQVKQGNKLLYRARYAGFDAPAAAAHVCGELKRLKIDCLVTKAE